MNPNGKSLTTGCWCFLSLVTLLLVAGQVGIAAERQLRLTPAQVTLRGNLDRAQLLVTEADNADQFSANSSDATADAKYISTDPAVVTVNERGQLLAMANGQALMRLTSRRFTVSVRSSPPC